MTELSFLLDLLLNHKLTKATQMAIKERISIVESQYSKAPSVAAPVRQNGQAPSMQAAIHALEQERSSETPPLPVVPNGAINMTVASSPVAAEALRQRNQAIAQAISGREEPGRTSPRKF